MAQLADDCFAFGGALMRLDTALALLRERISSVVGSEMVALDDAVGRVLAKDIVSDRDVPPHDNSAVDGYAVYHADLAPDAATVLPVAARLAAGYALNRPQQRGEAVRIFTGAPMPKGIDGSAGPDTVMMQEDCSECGGRVRLAPGITRGANRRTAGEDVSAGATILTAGRRLRPQDVGIAASIGLTNLPVCTPLRVAVFSTGDEIRDPGTHLASGTVYDANRFLLKALIARLGATVTDLGILSDHREAIARALADAAANHDLLLTSGGMSMGEEDHVRAAVEDTGSLYFWRLAIKPGRPLALGQVAGTPFIGLPGNPAAAMVTFLKVARPLVQRLMGAVAEPPLAFPIIAGFAHVKKKDRREFLRATVEPGPNGPVAMKFPHDGAGILSSLVAADGLAELPEDMTRLEVGAKVAFTPFAGLLS